MIAMSQDTFKAQLALYQRLTDWMREADELSYAFRNAGLVVPDPLTQALSDVPKGEYRPSHVPAIPPIKRSKTPLDAGSDWISISANDGSPTSVTLAVLKGANGPMRAKDVADRVTGMISDVTYGSIANIATRLAGEKIQRTDEGWALVSGSATPVLLDGFLWGPPSVFSKQDLAAHRREAIVRVLEHFPSGLQIVQLVEELKKLGWVRAPINKDLLKEDVAVLRQLGKIKRRGNAGKWEIGREETTP